MHTVPEDDEESFEENYQTDLKRRNVETKREEAELNVAFERELYKTRHPRFKTLYYGLKMNHPHRVALVHPILFLLRRIMFAVIIVFMVNLMVYNVLGVFMLMLTCLFMLGFVLTEWLWQSKWINY